MAILRLISKLVCIYVSQARIRKKERMTTLEHRVRKGEDKQAELRQQISATEAEERRVREEIAELHVLHATLNGDLPVQAAAGNNASSVPVFLFSFIVNSQVFADRLVRHLFFYSCLDSNTWSIVPNCVILLNTPNIH